MFEKSTKIRTYLKVALFGDGGSGKTRFLLSFPGIHVVDTERGTDPYRSKYDFQVWFANRWRQINGILDFVEKNPGKIGTLAFDSTTIFYQDLVHDMVEYVKNKRGHEVLSQMEWTVIKRRWAEFMNRLVELPCHVLLSMRERDEYEETTNRQGEEVRKKTGNQLMDVDKQTKYLFDLSLRCFTEENKKEKTSKFMVRVDKTRYDWMPKYAVYEITGKRAFNTLFSPHLEGLGGEEAPILRRDQPAAEEPKAPEEAPEGKGVVEKASSTGEAIGELLQMFVAPTADPAEPGATGEDVKVLMTRCGQLTWPDGSKFESADGKALIQALFKVKSSKELRKSQVDWLYGIFGKVLSGESRLVRDEKGVPFIAAAKTEKIAS